jgi:hypothetical protein
MELKKSSEKSKGGGLVAQRQQGIFFLFSCFRCPCLLPFRLCAFSGGRIQFCRLLESDDERERERGGKTSFLFFLIFFCLLPLSSRQRPLLRLQRFALVR